MIKLCGIIALILFTICAAVHLATFIPSIPISMDLAWPLHLAAIAVFASMVFAAMAQFRWRPKKPVVGGFFARLRATNEHNRQLQKKVLSMAPRWVRVVCVAMFVYMLLNFVLFIVLMEGGGPSVENGKFVLSNHGQTIRAISRDEYLRFRALEVRGFSGHWMIFSMIPAVYFLAVHPRLKELK